MNTVSVGSVGAISLIALGIASCSGSKDKDTVQSEGTGGATSLNLGEVGGGAGSNGLSSVPPDTDLVLVSDVVEGGADALRRSACAGSAIETEQVPVVLQLIVDVSGSMNALAPGGSDTKWNITRSALVTSMDGMRQDSSVGVTFYPNRTTQVNNAGPAAVDTCVDQSDNVPIEPLGAADSPHRLAIQNSFQGVEPANPAGTPTHDAFNIALESLKASTAPGDRYILLITDGQPTFSEGCFGTGATAYPVDEQPIVAAIAAAAAEGIRTYVIGSPGSESNESTGADARLWLSAAAREGGTATPGCSDSGPNYCHFDMTQNSDFGAALSEALVSITATLMCNYQLGTPPAGQSLDPNAVNLIYTSSGSTEYLVVQNGAESCDLGWRLDAATHRVEVCGSTCDTLKADPKGRVELLLGCMPVVGAVQ